MFVFETGFGRTIVLKPEYRIGRQGDNNSVPNR